MANRETILSLKVFIQLNGTTKVLRFSSELAVIDAKRDIMEKCHLPDRLDDHGLYLAPTGGKKGMWMNPKSPLRAYGLISGSTVEFKKMHRPLKVILVDGSTQTCIINDTKSVREIVEQCATKLKIKFADNFSLRRTAKNHLAAIQDPSKREKAIGRLVPWLKESQTLHEQGIGTDEELELRKKYYVFDEKVTENDFLEMNLLYWESQKSVLRGEHNLAKSDSRIFCSLQMQIEFGDYDPNKHVVGCFDKSRFLTPAHRKDDKKNTLELEIFAAYAKLKGMKEMACKFRYVTQLRSLKTYGIVFFENMMMRMPTQNKKEAPQMRPFKWGVSKNRILKFEQDTGRELNQWPYGMLRRWEHQTNQDSLILDFGDLEAQTLHGPEVGELIGIIQGYIYITLKVKQEKEAQARIADEEGDGVGVEVEMNQYESGTAQISYGAGGYGDGYGGQGAMVSQMARQHRQSNAKPQNLGNNYQDQLHILRYQSKANAEALNNIKLDQGAPITSCTDENVKQKYLNVQQKAQVALKDLNFALDEAERNPGNVDGQNKLRQAVQFSLPIQAEFRDASKDMSQVLQNPIERRKMQQQVKDLEAAFGNLPAAIDRLRMVEEEAEINAAIQEINDAKQELNMANFFADMGTIPFNENYTLDSAFQYLEETTNLVDERISRLTAATQKADPNMTLDEIVALAKDIAALSAATQIAAGQMNPDTDKVAQKAMIKVAQDACDDALRIIKAAQDCRLAPIADEEKLTALQNNMSKLKGALSSLINCMKQPTMEQTDVLKQDIDKAKQKLYELGPPDELMQLGLDKLSLTQNFKDTMSMLQADAKMIHMLADPTQRKNPKFVEDEVDKISDRLGANTVQLLDLISLADASTDFENTDELLAAAANFADLMKGFLDGAKDLKANSSQPAKVAPKINAQYQQLDATMKGILMEMKKCGAMNPEMQYALAKIMTGLDQINLPPEVDSSGIPYTYSKDFVLSEILETALHFNRAVGILNNQAKDHGTNVLEAQNARVATVIAEVVDRMLKTASATQRKTDPNIVSLSGEGTKFVRTVDLLVSNSPKNLQGVAANLRDLNSFVPILVQSVQDRCALINPQTAAVIQQDLQNFLIEVENLNYESGIEKGKIPTQNGPFIASDPFIYAAQNAKNLFLTCEANLVASLPNLDELVDANTSTQIMNTASTLALVAHDMVRAVSGINDNPKNRQDLGEAIDQYRINMDILLQQTQPLNGSISECQKAMKTLQDSSSKLDGQNIEVQFGALTGNTGGKSFQAAQNDAIPILKQLDEDIQLASSLAGNTSVDQMKRTVQKIREDYARLMDNVEVVAVASKEQKVQQRMIECSKAVNDNLKALVHNIQNHKITDKESLARITDSAAASRKELGNLLGQLQTGTQLQQDLQRICGIIKAAMDEIPKPIAPSAFYGECKANFVTYHANLATNVTQLVNVNPKSINAQIGLTAQRIGEIVPILFKSARLCAATTKDATNIKNALLENTTKYGAILIHLLLDVVNIIASSSANNQAKNDENANKIQKDFSIFNVISTNLMTAVKKGDLAESMIDAAIASIGSRISMLNTTSIFAEAGQLEVNKQAAMYSITDLQNQINSDYNKLINACAALAQAIESGSEEALGNACHGLDRVIDKLANIVIALTSKLLDANTVQQEVLTAIKLVAISANRVLINCKDVLQYFHLSGSASKDILLQNLEAFKDTAKTFLTTIQAIDEVQMEAEKKKEEQIVNTERQRRTSMVSNANANLARDPDSMVEQELLRCFKIIEESASALSKVVVAPKTQARAEGNPLLAVNLEKIDASIMESATALIQTASALLQSSVQAQKERAAEKQQAHYRADPIWANGLISASQKVALSVQELVSSANLIASTETGEEEAVIAAARGVASSTAHLVAASRAKGDPHSPAQIAISNHAKQVAQFAAKLTAAANERGLVEDKKETEASPANSRPVTNSIFFEMEQNIKIQNLEKQLEQEMQKQRRMRQEKYKGAK